MMMMSNGVDIWSLSFSSRGIFFRYGFAGIKGNQGTTLSISDWTSRTGRGLFHGSQANEYVGIWTSKG